MLDHMDWLDRIRILALLCDALLLADAVRKFFPGLQFRTDPWSRTLVITPVCAYLTSGLNTAVLGLTLLAAFLYVLSLRMDGLAALGTGALCVIAILVLTLGILPWMARRGIPVLYSMHSWPFFLVVGIGIGVVCLARET